MTFSWEVDKTTKITAQQSVCERITDSAKAKWESNIPGYLDGNVLGFKSFFHDLPTPSELPVHHASCAE